LGGGLLIHNFGKKTHSLSFFFKTEKEILNEKNVILEHTQNEIRKLNEEIIKKNIDIENLREENNL
jgi:hypothetical protein